MQTLENLEADGLVGLYRVGRKEDGEVRADQERYLSQSDFQPSPSVLRDLLGPLGPARPR